MDLMADLRMCRTCKARRAAEEKTPRLLVKVERLRKAGTPLEPLWLCPYCDGDALMKARHLEAQR